MLFTTFPKLSSGPYRKDKKLLSKHIADHATHSESGGTYYISVSPSHLQALPDGISANLTYSFIILRAENPDALASGMNAASSV